MTIFQNIKILTRYYSVSRAISDLSSRLFFQIPLTSAIPILSALARGGDRMAADIPGRASTEAFAHQPFGSSRNYLTGSGDTGCPALKAAAVRLQWQWRADLVLIEDNSNGTAPAQQLRADRHRNVITLPVTGSKVDRFFAQAEIL